MLLNDAAGKFQSTLPRGERLDSWLVGFLSGYFNPRSHEGSDYPNSAVRAKIAISIHAPTRGATVPGMPDLDLPVISIHAPTRGATIFTRWNFSTYGDFNPRSHEGSDSTLRTLRYHRTISIHAPTRGATCFRCILRWPPTPDFNPRSHEGSDDNADIVVIEFGTFQSTLPRGERPVPDAA